MTAPVVTSTGSYSSGATSVSFSGIAISEAHFSGATLSYSGIAIGLELGSISLTGTIANLEGVVSGLTPNATYAYAIIATDLAGNTSTVQAGNFSTTFLPVAGLFSTAS